MAPRLDSDSMRAYLGPVCAEAREQANLKRVQIAGAVPVSQQTIDRFEKGETWPREADQIIAAYAELTGVEPLELWQRAFEAWRRTL